MIHTTSRPILTRIAFGLLWLFVFTLPLTQATEIPHVAAISAAAGFLAMIAGVVAVTARRQVRLLAPVHLAMAAFVLWSAVTLFWSVAPDLTMQRILTYLQLFVLVLLTWEMCEEENDILWILNGFVLGTILPALSTLKGFLPGQKELVQRASAAGFDANSLAFILALSLPVSYYLILRDKTPLSAIYGLQMSFAVCAILLTGSAAAMIAMVIGLSLVFWTIHLIPVRTRTNAFVLLMLLGAASTLLLPSSLWKHLAEESRNAVVVTAVIDNGVEGIRSTPLQGFGAGSMSVANAQAVAPQKASFTMLSETGVVGVGCFIAMLGMLFLSADKMSGATKSFWLTVLAVWAAGAISLNWTCVQPAWLLFGLLAAHSACTRREAVSKAEREQKQNYYVHDATEVWS